MRISNSQTVKELTCNLLTVLNKAAIRVSVTQSPFPMKGKGSLDFLKLLGRGFPTISIKRRWKAFLEMGIVNEFPFDSMKTYANYSIRLK